MHPVPTDWERRPGARRWRNRHSRAPVAADGSLRGPPDRHRWCVPKPSRSPTRLGSPRSLSHDREGGAPWLGRFWRRGRADRRRSCRRSAVGIDPAVREHGVPIIRQCSSVRQPAREVALIVREQAHPCCGDVGAMCRIERREGDTPAQHRARLDHVDGRRSRCPQRQCVATAAPVKPPPTMAMRGVETLPVMTLAPWPGGFLAAPTGSREED